MKEYISILLAVFLIINSSCSNSTKEIKITDEQLTSGYFETIKHDSTRIYSFIEQMPKGGDIHHHSRGSVMAETYIENALLDSLYVDTKDYQLYETATTKTCEEINILLKTFPYERDSIIDYWSVRNYVKYNRDGHDWFFNTFNKFSPAYNGHQISILSKLCKRAKSENVQYLETMIGMDAIGSKAFALGSELSTKTADTAYEVVLTDWYSQLHSLGIDKLAQENADSLDHIYSKVDKHGVKLKFLTFGLRVIPSKEAVFSHLVLCFKTADLSENVVGVNFVAPEDNSVALIDYGQHMDMFRFLKEKYPKVNISLHAGELVMGKGFTTENDLTFHINDALFKAGSMRIGHGVDIDNESNNDSIFAHMAREKVAVEINLRSNEVILERNEKNHPFKDYLQAKVPVCLSTDDAGVLRTNISSQYMLALKYFPGISYSELKKIAQNSVTYSFMNNIEKQEVLSELEEDFKEFEANIASKL